MSERWKEAEWTLVETVGQTEWRIERKRPGVCRQLSSIRMSSSLCSYVTMKLFCNEIYPQQLRHLYTTGVVLKTHCHKKEESSYHNVIANIQTLGLILSFFSTSSVPVTPQQVLSSCPIKVSASFSYSLQGKNDSMTRHPLIVAAFQTASLGPDP